MRNLLTFSTSAIIHGFIAVGVGALLLTDSPSKAKNISEVLEWQWLEETTPPPPVVTIQEPESPSPEVSQPQPLPKPEPVMAGPIKKATPKPKTITKPKSKPQKKQKPRAVVKKKSVQKRQKKRERDKAVQVKSSPKAPLFQDFSGQHNLQSSHLTTKSKPHPAVSKERVNSRGNSPQVAKVAHPKANPNEFAKYKRALRAAIERHKKYPRREQRMGITGTVVVSFQVNGDGQLSGIQITRSSGNRKLDAAARAAVESVGRYQAPPNGQSFHTSISVSFVLR